MEICERISEIADEKGVTKRELVKRIIELEPRLKRTGESPSESSIYNYLNGYREIKVELIPYIAEALGIFEQELFLCNERDKQRFYKKLASENELDPELGELLQYASPALILHIKQLLQESKELTNTLIQNAQIEKN